MADNRREALLVQNRISQLAEHPIRGPFDLDHLRAVHFHIFRDLPHHRPGEVRSDTSGWSKNRLLEGSNSVHEVHYAYEGIADRIRATLRDLGGPAVLKGLEPDAFASRVAKLYGDLDHAHAFYEGNSRTLREFTRSLALASGYELDWTPTNVTAAERNRLYVARDIAVLERAFPGLTPERGMQTSDRAEYEAFLALPHMRRIPGASLEAIIREGLHQLPGPAAEMTTAAPRQSLAARLLGEMAARDRPDPFPSARQPRSQGGTPAWSRARRPHRLRNRSRHVTRPTAQGQARDRSSLKRGSVRRPGPAPPPPRFPASAEADRGRCSAPN